MSEPSDPHDPKRPEPILNYATPGPLPDMVTLAGFSNPVEANLAAEKLRDAGIACYLDGENFQAATGGWYGNAGGIKLKVAQDDAERAAALLPKPEQRRGPKCPNCGSHHTASDPPGCLWEGLAILLIVPYMLLTVKHKCADCGWRWVPPEDEEEEDPEEPDEAAEDEQ